MWYGIFSIVLLLLVASLFHILKQIQLMSRQIQEKRPIRISLFGKTLENLATQLIQQEEEQKKLQLQLLREEEDLKQSIANISHDLRTPLTSMKGYLSLLEESSLTKEQKDYVKVLQKKTNYLTKLVSDFYDLSLLEQEDYKLELKKTDINLIVTECLLEKYGEFQNIQPLIQTPNTPVWILGNETACRRITENLLSNALHYCKGYIAVSLEKNGILTVQNSAYLPQTLNPNLLFQKFYTADTARSSGNSGLGLYIVTKLLKNMKGTLHNVNYENEILTISIQFFLL